MGDEIGAYRLGKACAHDSESEVMRCERATGAGRRTRAKRTHAHTHTPTHTHNFGKLVLLTPDVKSAWCVFEEAMDSFERNSDFFFCAAKKKKATNTHLFEFELK